MIAELIALQQLMPIRLGHYHLPVFEIDRARFQLNPTRVRPFQNNRFAHAGNVANQDPLRFSMWKLMHACYRATLLRANSMMEVNLRAGAYFLGKQHAFARTPELRLVDGQILMYESGAGGDLAKEIGEGVNILFMESRGYFRGERLDALLARYRGDVRAATPWRTRRANLLRHKNGERPDFIFENRRGDATALAEAKGGFVADNETARITGELRDGLQQLEGWSDVIAPRPHKEFTVATFLREETDPHNEPSMIVFVDPENEPTDSASRSFPSDAIRRGNYAAWLRGMGFYRTASDLLSRRMNRDVQPTQLMVIDVGDKRLVLLPFLIGEFGLRAPLYWVLDEIRHGGRDAMRWFLRDFGGILPVLGIEERVLRGIERTLQTTPENQYLEPVIFESEEILSNEALSGSFQADGSFFGALGGRIALDAKITIEKFKL